MMDLENCKLKIKEKGLCEIEQTNIAYNLLLLFLIQSSNILRNRKNMLWLFQLYAYLNYDKNVDRTL